MGLKNWVHNKRMKDPVQGSYQLTGCSISSGGASHENCRMHGVVTAPGVGPIAVEHYCTAPVKRWPQPGMSLPVTVDRADPTRLEIDWDQVPSNRDRAEQQAQWLAQSMGGVAPAGQLPVVTSTPTTTTSTTRFTVPPGQQGLPPQLGEEVRSLMDKLIADAKASGATVTTNVSYDVLGAPGRPMPGATGGGLTPEQAAAAVQGDPAAAGLQRASARVIAVHEVAVPPGMPGGGPAGTVDLTLDVTLPSGEGFATTMRLAFSTPDRRARIATIGTVLPVLVDPNAHDRIAIDTSQMT